MSEPTVSPDPVEATTPETPAPVAVGALAPDQIEPQHATPEEPATPQGSSTPVQDDEESTVSGSLLPEGAFLVVGE